MSNSQNSLTDSVESVGATIMAHEGLLQALIAKAIQRDPQFQAFALKELHEYLGQTLNPDPSFAPHDAKLLSKARQSFINTLDAGAKIAETISPTSPMRLTLRRRFLNWLQSG